MWIATDHWISDESKILAFNMPPKEGWRAPGALHNLTVGSDLHSQVSLSWSPPLDDGGSQITRYQVQVV